MAWRINGLAFEDIAEKRGTSLVLMELSPAESRHKAAPERLSDVALIHRILEGEVDLFEHLLNRHRNRVVGIVCRHVPQEEIEEIAHDVFIRAFKSLSTFRQKSDFKHWIGSIAVRTCHDFWRKRYRSREVAVSSLSLAHQKWLEHIIAEESSASFSEENDRKEAGEILKWALCQLSEKDKTVLELIYFQDYSIKETAELLGWNQTTVKVRSFRARQKLQKILTESMEPNSGDI